MYTPSGAKFCYTLSCDFGKILLFVLLDADSTRAHRAVRHSATAVTRVQRAARRSRQGYDHRILLVISRPRSIQLA